VGKGTNRAYKVVSVEDEPGFGDPPRNWARVASMAGVWAVVLLGTAWVAPGFASGGGEQDLPAVEQPPTDPLDAADRYFDHGFDNELSAAHNALCEEADPEVTPDMLRQLRLDYEEELNVYPQAEVNFQELGGSGGRTDFKVEVNFIGGSRSAAEEFRVTVEPSEDRYCVAQVVRHGAEEGAGSETDPQEQAARYLSAVFVVRDLEAASDYQCAEYEGPGPDELGGALDEWEALFGGATAIQSFEGDPVRSGTRTAVPMSVKLSSGQAIESFTFEVTVEDGCVAALSGGAALLESTED
jgi:hypothetical protein